MPVRRKSPRFKLHPGRNPQFTTRIRDALRDKYPADESDKRYRYGCDPAALIEDMTKVVGEAVPSMATIAKLLSGDSASSEWTPLIAELCQVRAVWLAHGVGPKVDGVLPAQVRQFAYQLVEFEKCSAIQRGDALADIMQLLVKITSPSRRSAH